ncbi:hypothetical protein NKH77_41975 [Streptomyces sp. M19]
MAAVMWPYWLCGGQPAEACHWLELALAQQPEVTPSAYGPCGGPPRSPLSRATRPRRSGWPTRCGSRPSSSPTRG